MSTDPSLFPGLLRGVAALAFTLGLILTAAWAYRRYGNNLQLPASKPTRLTILEKRTLNINTTLYLIRHDASEHLIAVTGNQTILLHTSVSAKAKKKP